MEEVRNRVRISLPKRAPYRQSEAQKRENINSFNALSRADLINDVMEKRILLYETTTGEEVYIQFPGKESVREGARRFPLDAKPVLKKQDGTYADDMDFKKIWDIIDQIGRNHLAETDILATIFVRIAFMISYQRNDGEFRCDTVDISTNEVVSSEEVILTWNSLKIDDDVMETLNDRFGLLEGISFEGFLYYNDLLAQNEDCKYCYLHGEDWKITTGRINNCLSHLTVISYIRGHIGVSKLIDSFQRAGVAPLPQSRFYEACGNLVEEE